MTEYNEVSHVIFDVDGLLLDTIDIIHNIHNRTLSQFGHKLHWGQCMSMMGGTAVEVNANIRTMFDLPITAEKYSENNSQFCEELLPTCDLMPGAERLVKHLYNHGIPIAIASGGSKKYFDLKIVKHKSLIELFSHIVMATSDPDVKSGKPAPDVFLVCAQRFPDSPDPKKCLVFEDAPNGVISARAAGMQVVLVPDKRLPRSMRENATQLLDSLEHFKPEEFGLPAFTDQ